MPRCGAKSRWPCAMAEYFLRRPMRTVLDIGCGEGAWLPHLRALRPKIVLQRLRFVRLRRQALRRGAQHPQSHLRRSAEAEARRLRPRHLLRRHALRPRGRAPRRHQDASPKSPTDWPTSKCSPAKTTSSATSTPSSAARPPGTASSSRGGDDVVGPYAGSHPRSRMRSRSWKRIMLNHCSNHPHAPRHPERAAVGGRRISNYEKCHFAQETCAKASRSPILRSFAPRPTARSG